MSKVSDNLRAEQSRAEQSRAEQSRAEQSRAEQSRAEQTNVLIFCGVFHTGKPSAGGWQECRPSFGGFLLPCIRRELSVAGPAGVIG